MVATAALALCIIKRHNHCFSRVLIQTSMHHAFYQPAKKAVAVTAVHAPAHRLTARFPSPLTLAPSASVSRQP